MTKKKTRDVYKKAQKMQKLELEVGDIITYAAEHLRALYLKGFTPEAGAYYTVITARQIIALVSKSLT